MGLRRSLRKAAGLFYGDEYLSKPSAKERQMFRWSTHNNWVARCGAYDTEQDRIFQIEQHEAIKEMNKRQASLGAAMQSKGIDCLLDINPGELTPDQAARLAKTGVDIERPARGEATEISEHKGSVGINLIRIDPAIAKRIGDELSKQDTD